jgi:DHA2 family multidrug resistance protein
VTTGLAFVPLSAMAFSTLPAALRNEATALFNLLRNVAASIGISVTAAVFTRNIQVAHAGLATHVTPFNLHSHHPGMAAALATPQGTAHLNEVITAQASWLSYIDDFKMMMVMTLLATPLLFVLKPSRKKAAAPAVIAD